MEKQLFSEFIQKANCIKCDSTLEDATVIPVVEMPSMTVLHITCKACKNEAMTTVTPSGETATMDINTDLKASEIKKFLNSGPITDQDILSLYKIKNIWNYLRR